MTSEQVHIQIAIRLQLTGYIAIWNCSPALALYCILGSAREQLKVNIMVTFSSSVNRPMSVVPTTCGFIKPRWKSCCHLMEALTN
jgi:hypothetical protein